MNFQPSLLLAIPAYRESKRLPGFLANLADLVQKQYPKVKILVVDDGSGEEEQRSLMQVVSTLQRQFPCILTPLLLAENRGKGGAILEAWDRGGDYDYLAFVDADGAISGEEVCRLAAMIPYDSSNPAIFSSRIRMLGRKVSRKWKRHLSGRLFAFIVGYFIEPGIYDSQCGLKFLPIESYRKIRLLIQGRGFAFDIELIAALKSIGWPIVEVPIDWIDVPGRKVNFINDTFLMLISVLKIKNSLKTWISLKENN